MQGTLPCPGLTVTTNAGITWTDSTHRVHDLAAEQLLTLEECAQRPELKELGFATPGAVSALIASTRLYPAFRRNPRVLRVYACALPDFRRRLTATLAPATPKPQAA